MDFNSNIQGAPDLIASLKALPKSMANKALRPAMRKAAEIIKEQTAANIKDTVSSESTGLLAKSLVIRSLKMKKGMLRVAVAIGKRVSAKGVRVGLYGSVLEYGKEGQEPRPYMRTAAKESTGRVIAALVAEARQRLNAAIQDVKK